MQQLTTKRVRTIKETRLDGKPVPIGTTVTLEVGLARTWERLGLAVDAAAPDKPLVENQPDAGRVDDDRADAQGEADNDQVDDDQVDEEGAEGETEWPKHLGFGKYLLPNGEQVKGKEAALAAMAALKAE